LEFLLVSAQRPSEDGGVGIFTLKMDFWAPNSFTKLAKHGGTTAKTSIGEDLVKIHPAVAKQSRQKK